MKNKKLIIAVMIVLIVLIIGLVLFFSKDSGDNRKFYNDYGKKVPKGTEIVYLTDDGLKNALSTDDKLMFFGNPSSKETISAVKTLLNVAEDNGIDKIYYYDTRGIERNDEIAKSLGKGNIVSPTLLLIKDKKINEISEGLDKNLEQRYEDIMIAYIMCNTPSC